jgi:hypothetical protein
MRVSDVLYPNEGKNPKYILYHDLQLILDH